MLNNVVVYPLQDNQSDLTQIEKLVVILWDFHPRQDCYVPIISNYVEKAFWWQKKTFFSRYSCVPIPAKTRSFSFLCFLSLFPLHSDDNSWSLRTNGFVTQTYKANVFQSCLKGVLHKVHSRFEVAN